LPGPIELIRHSFPGLLTLLRPTLSFMGAAACSCTVCPGCAQEPASNLDLGLADLDQPTLLFPECRIKVLRLPQRPPGHSSQLTRQRMRSIENTVNRVNQSLKVV